MNELSGSVIVIRGWKRRGKFIPSILEKKAALTMPAAILRNNLIV